MFNNYLVYLNKKKIYTDLKNIIDYPRTIKKLENISSLKIPDNTLNKTATYDFGCCILPLSVNYARYCGLEKNLKNLNKSLEQKVTDSQQIKILMDERMGEFPEYKDLSVLCSSEHGFTIGDIAHKIFNFMTEELPLGCRDNLALSAFIFNPKTMEVKPLSDS